MDIVNLKRRCPIDLRTDHEAETIAALPKAHPGIAVISRDRADTYAETAWEGSPAAMQVAGRWHVVNAVREVLAAAATSASDVT
jgi:transposase